MFPFDDVIIVSERNPAWYIPFPRADGGFHWTDRSSFQYEKWNLGEPNSNGNDDEDCVLMYTKGHDGFYWDDVGCDEYHPFMCKTDQGMIYLTLYNMKANVSKAPLITRWKKQLLLSWFLDILRKTSVYEYIQSYWYSKNVCCFKSFKMILTWQYFNRYTLMERSLSGAAGVAALIAGAPFIVLT